MRPNCAGRSVSKGSQRACTAGNHADSIRQEEGARCSLWTPTWSTLHACLGRDPTATLLHACHTVFDPMWPPGTFINDMHLVSHDLEKRRQPQPHAD